MESQTIVEALLLGLLEGLTEFIPVSSTGHLLLAKMALGLKDASWDTFIVLIQLGAILAVVVLYFQRLWRVVMRLPSDPGARRFALSVIVACIPAFIAGFLVPALGISLGTGIIAAIIHSTIGAVILLVLIKVI